MGFFNCALLTKRHCVLRKYALDEIPDRPTLADGGWLSWWLNTEGVRVAELADFLGMTTSGVYAWMKPEKKLHIIAEYAIRQAMKTLTERNYIRDEVKSAKG